MAGSDTAQISTIVDLIQIINPKTILDVGCGYGKYGFLSKEFLIGDTWDKNKTIVYGVEGYAKYINELHRDIYHDVYICNALDFDKYLKINYDLIFIIDVFEHLTDEQGAKFIRETLKKCKYLLISIPRYVTFQEGLDDDNYKFERHRLFWTRKMFKSFGNCLIIPNNARKTIALYSQNGKFERKIKQFISKKLVLKFLPYIFVDLFNFFRWFINRNNESKYVKKSKFSHKMI